MGACARIMSVVLAALFAGGIAVAQTGCGTCQTGTLYAEKAPTTGSLTIYVTASVGGHCGFSEAPSGTHDEPNFDDHAWTHDFPFELDCSGPSRVAIESANGGLLTSGAAPAGYTTLAPYNVELNLVRNSGSPANASCAAADLDDGGGCSFAGNAADGDGLFLASGSQNQTGSYVRVSAPIYAGSNILVSGNYADTLTVTVSAAN